MYVCIHACTYVCAFVSISVGMDNVLFSNRSIKCGELHLSPPLGPLFLNVPLDGINYRYMYQGGSGPSFFN